MVGCDRSSKPSRAPLRRHGWPAPPPRSRRSRRLASATLGPSPLPAKQRGTNEYILQSPDAAKFLEEWYLKIFGLLITGSLVFRATSDFGFPSNFASAKEISVHRLLLVQPVFFFDVEWWDLLKETQIHEQSGDDHMWHARRKNDVAQFFFFLSSSHFDSSAAG